MLITEDEEFEMDLDPFLDILNAGTPTFDLTQWESDLEPNLYVDILALADEDLSSFELLNDDAVLDAPEFRWEPSSLILEHDPTVKLYSLSAWTAHEAAHRSILECEDYADDIEDTPTTSIKQEPNEEFECTFCDKKFTNASALNNHIADHESVKVDHIPGCPHCDFTYKSESQLVRHFKRCHPEQLFICHYCMQVFVNMTAYESHITSKFCQQFSCDSCDASFARADLYKMHLRTHNERIANRCHLCNTTYATKFKLASHKHKTHNSRAGNRCERCQTSYKTKVSLARHTQKAHNGNVAKRCKRSKTVYAKKVKLAKHTQLTHNGNAENRCERCKTSYETRIKLARHIRLTHAPHRFVCEICEKRFVRPDHYQIHMRRHNAQKPCVCNFCGKRFCQKSDLNRHRKYVHLGFVRKLRL